MPTRDELHHKVSALKEDLAALQRFVKEKLVELAEAERQAALQAEETARLLALQARAGPLSPVPVRKTSRASCRPLRRPRQQLSRWGLPPQQSAAFMVWMSSQP